MTTAPASHSTREAPRILLVDDEPLGRLLVRQHLPREYRVTECVDAEGALRAARSSPHDVALVDVLLPGLDGFALCRQLKSDPLTADMPVIVVTAKSGIEDLERGFEAGATDYVRKPFNPRELIARVRNAVELKQQGDDIRRWNERIARDLALAGALQRSLLAPRPFLGETMRIHTAYQSSSEVGGDFFDILPVRDGRIAVYVGDVAGHGVGAAIASTLLKVSMDDLLREHAPEGPARVANELHRIFLSQLRAPGLYATLFLAIVDPARRHWRCINCGHPAPIVLSPVGLQRSDFEERGGPPVGLCLVGDHPFQEQDEINLTLPDESAILLLTDGLLEGENPAQPEASARQTLAGLLEKWRTTRGGPPMKFIFDGMRAAGFALKSDDCTALLVEEVPASRIIFRGDAPVTAHDVTRLAWEMEEALRAAGWPDASTWAAHLLLVEHGANVVKHGRPAPGARLSAQVLLGAEALELLVRDGGQPWSYEEAPVLEPGESDDHGRGLLAIRRVASYVASQRDGDENVSLFGVLRNWQVPHE